MADDINKIVDDALSFPVLTEEIDFHGGSGQSGTKAGASPLGQKVDIALREILGWRPRLNDPRGFLASLNQSFEVKNVEGHTEWTWRQRTFAAEADLGAITGAQASIYTRARAALDHSLPLLDGLTPLRADHDLQDIDTARAIVRSSFTELVYELGVEGGPQLVRVDGYFQDLLGPIAALDRDTILANPEEVGGQLALLRDEFGLIGEEVNTIDEEQNLTNFFILVDSINSLWLTWRTQRSFFDHRDDGKAFLGTQSVLLSRNLAVLNESVEEIYFAMNSVFLGPTERQVTKIKLESGDVVIVGELLTWVQRFAAEEGPRLLREGGKDGVINAFRPTLERLIKLVSGVLNVSMKNSKNPTAGFHTPRVRRSLEELKLNLETTRENAERITRLPGPVIGRLTKIPIETDVFMLIVNGRNFREGATVHLSSSRAPAGKAEDEVIRLDPDPSDTTFTSAMEIKTLFNENNIFDKFKSHAKSDGSLDLTVFVTNPDGQNDKTKPGKGLILLNRTQAMTKPPAPSIIRVKHDPVTDRAKLATLKVTVEGTNFQADTKLSLKIQGAVVPPMAGTLAVKPPSEIEATFDLSGKVPVTTKKQVEGQIIVTNPDHQHSESEAGKGVIIQSVP
jgi:hypothetical protein